MSIKTRYFSYFIFILLVIAAFLIVPKKAAIILNSKAVEQYQEGNIDKAISLYKKSLKLSEHAEVYYNLAVAYDYNNDIEQAIQNYNQAIKLDPGHVKAHQSLAEIYRYRKDFDKASEHIKAADKISGTVNHEKLAIVEKDKAIDAYNQAVESYDKGNYDYAVRRLKQAITIDPSFAPAYKNLGDIYFEINDLYNAKRYYSEAIGFDHEKEKAYNGLGLVYMQLESYGKAKQCLERAYELAPDNVDIKYNFASVLRDNNQLDDAMAIYLEILNSNPAYPNLHNDIANIYLIKGDEQLAKHEFSKELSMAKKMIELGDTSASTALRCAIAYKGLNQLAKAKEALDKIIHAHPDFYHAYYIRSEVFAKMGDIISAESDLSKARVAAKKDKSMPKPKSSGSFLPDQPAGAIAESLPRDLKADTVVTLTNGQKIKGRLKSHTDSKIVMEVDMGSATGQISFSSKKIKNIVTIK
jgi:tetratricopeptide (TPR) repeat protein